MYLNVTEVETALQVAETNFPLLIQRFALPNTTHEGRTCHGVKIANASGTGRVGVYFLGGIHAREWIPPDALINFIDVMTNAFQNNVGITIGTNNFTAAQIQSIVSTLDVFVFPQSNPDGRNQSQTVPADVMWRKNRRNNGGGVFGVDLNRNFDLMWNYPTFFSPLVQDGSDINPNERDIRNSTVSTSDVYIGPSAESEPETKNIVQIMDDNPNIRFFIDVHSYSELVLYNWGGDESQTTDIDENFRNTTYNGQRGVRNDSYGEYVSPADNTLRQNLGNSMRTAIQNVRGRTYTVQSSFDLYPTAGTSTDYVNSRSYVDPSLSKVHGFTIECATSFQPNLTERTEVIDEVTAALIRFCLEVIDLPSDIYIRDNLSDSGEEPLVGGGISLSPDICHYRTALANPNLTLGSALAKNQGNLFETVEIGQSNFIYVRLQNRGYKVDNAEIDIYWTQASTLPTPSSWNLIGSITANNIQPGEFRVTDPLDWNSVPAKGHYCFVGVIGTSTEPKPNINAISTINDFYDLIRSSNNVTWKNFDTDDLFAGAMAQFHFQVQGWRRTALVSELELDLSALPEDTVADLKILKRITENSTLENITIDKTSKIYNYLSVNSGLVSRINNMELRSSDNVQATLSLELPENIPDGVYDIAVIQKVDGREMGRITKRLNVGKFTFVANRRSHEIHRQNCPWVPKMSSKNKVAYGELKLGLKHGYDGCHTCLLEFDNG